MVAALHHNDVIAASLGPGDLDSCLDRLAARVPEEERVERRVGHHGEERLDELHIRLR